MFVLMMIIAGMAVALAIYFLLSAIFAAEPSMDIHTVENLGLVFSTFVFAFCGPVLVLKLWFFDENRRGKEKSGGLALIANGTIALLWSGVLGFIATRSAYLALEPSLLNI